MNERGPDDRFAIASTADLILAMRSADANVAESLCRKYVARNRNDLRGWHLLIGSVELNDKGREAVRLAELMVAELPGSSEAISFAGSVLATHGATDRAYALLTANAAKLEAFGLVTLGQLSLTRDINQAPRFFDRALKGGNELTARLGLASVRSLAAGVGAPAAFLLLQDWHRSIQQPIQDACADERLPSFMTTSPWLVREMHAPLMVVSDAPSGLSTVRRQIPDVRIVHTRHGLGDKNYGFAAAATADFVCVTSQAIADDYVRNGLLEPTRFWVTGYPQLDPLFRKVRSGGHGPHPRTVLFAPTFTEGLSAALKLGPDAIRLIRGADTSISVILRPHPRMRVTAPALLNEWRAQSLAMKNVELNDDPDADIGELMLRAAVMVTDVSSIALTYLALDRPIVCVDVLQEAKTSPNYAPDAIEWRMLKAAEVAEPRTLAAAVAAALAEPGRMSADRRRLRRYLFGDLTDGRAGERIARRIAEMVRHG